MELKVNWFVPTEQRDFNRVSASIWIRCLQLLPYLQARGVRNRVNDEDADADLAVFVRWQDKKAYRLARRLKKKGQRIVFDLCVNYFDEAGYFDGGYGTGKRELEDCSRMADVADVITCASDFIAERASLHHPRTVCLSDSIDNNHFWFVKDVEDFRRPQLRASFSGVVSKVKELEPILPLLQARDVPVTIITNRDPNLDASYRFVQWRYETFPLHILASELCLAHRSLDNPYNKGHSLFKIGVFMAQGVPAIASRVPAYEQIIKSETGGTLYDSLNDFEESLDSVLSDREILVKWSEQARSNLEPYRTDLMADRYVALFEEMCESTPEDARKKSRTRGRVNSRFGGLRTLLQRLDW